MYIVHAVPTAPMQRILYEVYQDRPAYDEHLSRPYMTRYVAERRSMVLATNAIELGLQQAKMSPLPSYSAISDLLSESGIDLTGVTRSSRGSAATCGRPLRPDGAAGTARIGRGRLPAAGHRRRRLRSLGRRARRGSQVPMTAAHTITLLSRPGCHLCDEARAVIARVADDLGVAWSERDITESQDDLRDYGEMIPVTLIDGVQHDFWRVDERRLRRALNVLTPISVVWGHRPDFVQTFTRAYGVKREHDPGEREPVPPAAPIPPGVAGVCPAEPGQTAACRASRRRP